MSITFPVVFQPSEWWGPRARAHGDRPDAFQALVGDALQEERGPAAHVVSLKGADGAIDAFVDLREGDAAPYFDLPLPLIVECKSHDPAARDLGDNVWRTWGSVREKLIRRARESWSGLYAPWGTARGYLYCVSVTLPSTKLRQKLVEDIQDTLESCVTVAGTGPTHGRVLDWSDIRAWLDRLPRVADRWLGTRLRALVAHEEVVAGLAGVKEYLLPRRLPFLAPPCEDSTHPRRLLERLSERAGYGGICLLGVGGVGKTRTAFEVAALAEEAGWRVLHARPGEPGLDAEDLYAALTQGSGAALLVLDYVDQMRALDPVSLRHRVLPDCLRQGVRLALFATARPSNWPPPHDPIGDWERLLEPIRLAPVADRAEAVARHIRTGVAPTAARLNADERLRRLCGRRPIIALLVAREFERRASSGGTNGPVPDGRGRDDLVDWLRLRLAESGLVGPRPVVLSTLVPDPIVVAATGILAATPLPADALATYAQRVLGDTDDARAAVLIAKLEQMGWIEREDAELSVAHDVVTDEALRAVLVDGDAGLLRTLLEAAKAAPRTLGRLAVSLSRLASVQSGERIEPVLRVARHWSDAAVTEVARAAEREVRDGGAYALGALLAAHLGTEPMIRRVQDLVTPWLERWGTTAEARHVLYAGLRRSDEASRLFLRPALRWLEEHAASREARLVLEPMLRRRDASDQASRIVDAASRYVALRGRDAEASFVLAAWLAGAAAAERAAEALPHALAWLDMHRTSCSASFVVAAALRRRDLRAHEESVTEQALAWLGEHGGHYEASFVLPPLLRRPGLPPHAEHAHRFARAWVETYPFAADAQFVLHAMLDKPCSRLAERTAETLALRWLDHHNGSAQARFVLEPLLRRPQASPTSGPALNHAVEWLRRHHAAPTALFVLAPLARWPDLGSATSDVLHWIHEALSRTPVPDEAHVLLRRVLRRPDLDDAQARSLLPVGIEWLRVHRQGANWDRLLASCLLRGRCLADRERQWVVERAQARLAKGHVFAEPAERLRQALQSLGADVPARAGDDTAAVQRQLENLVRDPGARPDPRTLQTALGLAEALVKAGHITRLGYLLAPLLPLTARVGDEADFIGQAEQLGRRLLADARMLDHQRAGFVRACWRLRENGAWPDAYVAEETFRRLGFPAEVIREGTHARPPDTRRAPHLHARPRSRR